MDLMLLGVLSLILSAILALALPNNGWRIGANLLCQLVACTAILSCSIPIVLGGEELTGQLAWSEPVGIIDLRVDALGAFFLAFSLPMTLLGSIYAIGYLQADIRSTSHVGTHFALLSVVQLSYVIIYTVQNAFAFLVGWEFAAISAWLLVIWYHRVQKIRFAGFNYLVSTHLGLLFLVAGIAVMHGATDSFQFDEFAKFLSTPSIRRNITFVLLMTSFGLKSAFFPFHTWLPRAHSAAPAHVSALMSGVIHKAGLFGMLKFILMVGVPEIWMGWYLLAVSCMSAFMGVLYTITQRDIKRMLGYSSTENVGIAGIGIGVGCLGLSCGRPALVAFGFSGAILHILNHALFKCLLFYGAGSIYRMTHTIDLEKLGGLHKTMPWTTPLFLLGSLAIAALPPFNGFVSEFLLYSGLLESVPELRLGRMALLSSVAVLAIVGGISALSVVRGFGLIFLGYPRDSEHVVHTERERIWMIFPMVVHGIGVLTLGLFPALAIRLVAAPTMLLLRLSKNPYVPLTDYVPMSLMSSVSMLSVILIVTLFVILAVRFAFFPRSERRHVTWGCGYTAPNTRMQYTGSSFSDPMVTVFKDLLKFVTRQSLPTHVFPKDGSYETHCVDSVERKIFDVLNRGENIAARLMARIPEHSGSSFALGLIALLLLVSLVSLR